MAIHQLLATIDPGNVYWVKTEWDRQCERHQLKRPRVKRWSKSMRGLVAISAEGNAGRVEQAALEMRTLHHVIRYLSSFEFESGQGLQQMEQALGELPLPEFQHAKAFRASCNRVGNHEFDSYQVMVLAGRQIQTRFGTPVDLKNYDLDLRIDLYQEQGWIGFQLTRKPLSHRFEQRTYLRRASLKTSIAFTMLQMADLPSPGTYHLLDPFCGAGTILLEAGTLYPTLQLLGSDQHEEPVKGSIENLQIYGLAHRSHVKVADARELSQTFSPESVDFIVTNPPYGLRMGQGLNMKRFYELFLREAIQVLKPSGKLVILVLKSGMLRQAARASGWQIDDSYPIEVGGKSLIIFRLRRPA